MRDLIIQGAALQWMWVCDERDSARLGSRLVDSDFERAGGTRDHAAPFTTQAQIFSLSTIRPCTMCESMISSMSCLST